MDSSHNEKLSESNYSSHDDSPHNSEDASEDYSRDYSESSILSSNKEFGPEGSQPNVVDVLSVDNFSVAWVPTFKERVEKNIDRLLDDSIKFCVCGKMNAPPIIGISLLKVGMWVLIRLKVELKLRSILAAKMHFISIVRTHVGLNHSCLPTITVW